MPFLKTNISKPWVTAKAGEEVTVTSFNHFPVIIVANKEGVRFSVMEYELDDATMVQESLPVIMEIKEVETEIIIPKAERKPVNVKQEQNPTPKAKPEIVKQSTLF